MSDYNSGMARPVRYSSPEAEDKVSRNPNADAISQRLRQKTLDRVKNEELGEVIEDPLTMLIEDARASS